MKPLLALACGALFCACAPAKLPAGEGKWEYDITFPQNAESGEVVVDAQFEEVGVEAFRFRDEVDGIVKHVEGPFVRDAGKWSSRGCIHSCRARYRVNVAEALRACEDALGCAVSAHGAVVAPISTWLLRPSPKRDVPAYVHVHGPVVSALARGKQVSLRSLDLDEGAFAAFGDVHVTHSEGMPIAWVGRVKQSSFVERPIRGIVGVFGEVRTLSPMVFVVSSDSEEARGKTMALSGVSVAVDIGANEGSARERVLLHEFAHLALPTFRGEGRWLGEGFAVYFESLIRARNDASDESAFIAHMQAIAREAPEGGSLLSATDDESIYAGGALFALALDLELHAHCRSLEEAVRGTLAKGANATVVMKVSDYLGDLERHARVPIAASAFRRAADLRWPDRRGIFSESMRPRFHAIFTGNPAIAGGCDSELAR